ncbi:unnamed protein product [Lymnaea stagnalis]|uniref:Ig-like domain-containing protein n=1 Tax=Lymnaea stagnalis TaxID=6523 RepID=A0AAV2HZN0_LYMST
MDNIYFITILVAFIAAPLARAENEVGGSIFYFGNKTATLSCNITSGGSTPVTWYFQNTSLKETGDRYTMTGTPSTPVLEIKKPTRDDAGQYTANFGTTANCTVNYTAAPLVLDMVKSMSVEKDDDLDIVCDIRGYPPAEVVWQRNGVNLTESALIQLRDYNGHINAQLYIEDVQYSDEGTYTCIAYSHLFNSSSTKSLVVRVKNPIAWVWPLIGIIVEIVLLGIVIFICAKLDKRRAIRADFNDTNQSVGQGHGGARKHGGDKHD